MIANDAFDTLSEEAIGQLSALFDSFNCPDVPCSNCPFVLERPYKIEYGTVAACAFGYAKELNRRLTK